MSRRYPPDLPPTKSNLWRNQKGRSYYLKPDERAWPIMKRDHGKQEREAQKAVTAEELAQAETEPLPEDPADKSDQDTGEPHLPCEACSGTGLFDYFDGLWYQVTGCVHCWGSGLK